jgi:hypothetical protein
MEAPKKIYVSIGTRQSLIARAGQTLKSDIEYIRKDALLEWAKEKQEQMKIEAGGCSNMLAAGKYLAYSELIEKIESL